MTVEDRRGCMGSEGGPNGDQFPIGMRVLAVDDDPTCLKLLETLLLRCQYHVTTTGQAITALNMLRENKDRFDLVISDVHMPDMDGFKLLELMGLEMDLPVIMLSANGETQAVMKGITHGACDYLLKPVRIEELRNIWQHVIRRRKFDAREHNSFDNGEDCEKALVGNSKDGQGPVASGVSDRDGKLNRKRKDQNEEDEDDCEENMHENEDASTQKKQRVVWSVDLHRKFVAAVNQLGVDKAVPKKILDIMNVQRLTRENVASHLQKYRLYLKRLSAVASQQANMVAAFGGRHPSYLPMVALEGFRNVHSLVGSRQLPALASFQPNGVLGRMSNPTGFGQHGLVSSRTVQQGQIHNNTSNHINDLGKLQGIGLLGNPNGSLLQGMPMSLELDRLQQHKTVQEPNNHFPDVFPSARLAIGSSSNSFANVTNSPLLLPANQQHTQSGALGSHSSARIPSLNSDPFKIGLGDSSHLPDLGRCNDTWQDAVPSTRYSANTSRMAVPSSHNNMPSNNILNNVTPIISHMDSNLHEASSSSVAVAPLIDSVIGNDVQHQASSLGGNTMLMPTGVDENSKFLSNSQQKWEERKQTHTHNPNLIFSSSPSLSNFLVTDVIAEIPTLNNEPLNENVNTTMSGQNFGATFLAQDCRTDCQLNYKEYPSESTKLLGGFSSNGCSFDDLVNAVIKPERDDVTFFDGDLVNDIYSLGTCM